MKQVYAHTFENMDVATDNKLTLKLNIAIVCMVLILCFYVCCWMAPIILRLCSKESNVQEHQSEDEIEMEELGRENNPDDTSNPITNEQSPV